MAIQEFTYKGKNLEEYNACNTEEDLINQQKNAGITGAAIGGGIFGWTGIIIIAVIIVGLAIILYLRKIGKKGKKK